MNLFLRLFVLVQLAERLLCAASYTLVLKQVKPLYPSVKVYRYEVRPPKILPDLPGHQYVYHKPVPSGQRIYPVVPKPQRPRVPPVKKEKKKFFPKGEQPLPRDPPLYGLSQELVPPVSNQIEEYSEAKEEETRDRDADVRPLAAAPLDEKSFPSFGQEKGRIYSRPGEWATPAPASDSENATFTPSRLYLQIRHKNTVIHVPQSEALKDAETLEELINAPRLKELARTTHVQEVYSEEGYEDGAYDHAGHIRHAQHGEVYDAKDEGRFKIKEPPVILDYDSDLEESKKLPLENVNADEEGDAGEAQEEKPEPRITRSRTETRKTSVEFKMVPPTYKGEHKYSSRVRNPVDPEDGASKPFDSTDDKALPSAETTFPSYFGEVPPALENVFANDSAASPAAPVKKSSKYRKGEPNSTKIYPVTESVKEFTDFAPYISAIDSQQSPSAKSLKYSRIYSKKTKQLSLQPYKSGNSYQAPALEDRLLPPPVDRPVEEESADQRIVLPTIGYINSLTTAHFGKGVPPTAQEESKTQLTSALNLTQALDYLRSNRSQKNLEPPKPPTETDIRTFEPMRLKKSRPASRKPASKTKRDVHLVRGRRKRGEQEYEGNDDSDRPHDEKNEEIAEDERKRIQEEDLEKAKYEQALREEISSREREILRETFKNIGVEGDVSEVFPEFPPSDDDPDARPAASKTTPAPVDPTKYPFYFSRRLPENSALRYATDPRQFPRKSGYRMEFYDSRERYIQCPDFRPDLDDLPSSDSTEYSDDQPGDTQRLAGVGEKINCLKMKYFDREPFDNPIFKEREIDYVGKRPRKPGKKAGKKAVASQTRASLAGPRGKITSSSGKSSKAELPKNLHSFNATPPPHRAKATTPPQNVFVFPQPVKLKANTSGKSATETTPPSATSFAQTIQNISRSPPFTIKTTPPRPGYVQGSGTPRIVVPRDCLRSLGQIPALDGTADLVVDCHDARVIQELVRGIPHLRIIPKERHPAPEQTEWVPIVGHARPKAKPADRSLPLTRKTDEVKRTQNETDHGSSPDHYVIDELKEEENVRQGEVVDDMDHYLKLMEAPRTTESPEDAKADNATRSRRDAGEGGSTPTEKLVREETGKPPEDPANGTVISRPFQSKRTLTRLSGRDFLVRYHKNKAKPIALDKTADFWKIPSQEKGVKKPPGTETPKTTPPSATPQLQTTPGRKSNEPRKLSPLNLIPERIAHKKPESKQPPEFWKSSTSSPPAEEPPSNETLTKIITKVSRETSESSEKPRVVYKKAEKAKQETTTGNPETSKPESPHYQTVSRGKSSPPKAGETRKTAEGPALYYIVDLRTGRGRWITEEDLRRGKLRKKQKPSQGGKRGKRRKKSKY